MRPLNVVLAQRDPLTAARLANSLRPEFRNLAIAESLPEIRSAVARLRAPLALIDLESISLRDLKQLCADFPATAFVSLHRLADEAIWSDSLAAGAADCCQSSDVQSILFAADRYVPVVRTAAA
jgi:DNA-binding NarL/FixJ family response regulator